MPLQGRIPITRNDILQKVEEEKIWSYYFGSPINVDDIYTNPLRADNSPGCKFYYASNGRLYFKDFSRGDHFDCFEFVQRSFNINFDTCLRKIASDLQLIEDTQILDLEDIKRLKKAKISLKGKRRAWKESDYMYWDKKYYIGDVYPLESYLEFMGVIPMAAVWLNNNYYRCKDNDPCYGYVEEGEIKKFYFPLRKGGQNKFIQSDSSWLQGITKLPEQGESLIITKSYKDVICLRLFGLYSIAPQSETVLLGEEQFADLYNRFDNIFSLMDNDRAGKHMAWLLRKNYEIPALLFPSDMQKDFSDNLEELGIVEMQEMIDYYTDRI